MNWHIYLLIGFLFAFLSPVLVRLLKSNFGWIVALWLGVGFFVLNSGQMAVISLPWSQTFNLSITFVTSGISKIFINIIFLVGSAVFIFTSHYLSKSDRLGKFYFAFTFFISSMLGLVTSDSFILAFMFWELTSISSYMLIGYSHEEESSRKSALQSLVITGAGGLCLFAGLLLLIQATGVDQFSELAQLTVPSSSKVTAALILILIGGLTKSAQFPFHFWLPNAMKAPAPVSALLHSATMVKAGIYLFLRLDPTFNEHMVWANTLTVLGAITLLLGAITAYCQSDLKKLLAYTTIATLGALTLLIGLEHPMSAQVALILFMGHAFYKATLFMVAGILEKITGQRDIKSLKALFKAAPLAGFAGFFSAISMIGVPPSLGFLSKELLLKIGLYEAWTIPIWMLSFALMGSVAWLAGVMPFLRKSQKKKGEWTQLGWLMSVGPFMLGILGIILSFDPAGFLTLQLSESVLRNQQVVPTHLWSGFNLPLVLSIVVIGGAAIGAYFHPKILKNWDKSPVRESALSDIVFDCLFNGILSVAKLVTDIFQNGNLTRYLLLAFIPFTILAPVVFFANQLYLSLDYKISDSISFAQIILLIIITICAWMAVTSQRRLTAIVSVGGIGYSIAGFYVLLGAPDLALTQVIVETLSVILFVFLLHEVPLLKSERKFWVSQGASLLIALGFGLSLSVLTWHSLSSEVASSISPFFGEKSYLDANGKNVVNVILVDFRAFDTLGEIAVLGIAAVTLSALLFKKKIIPKERL